MHSVNAALKHGLKDLTGQTFGKWRVESYAGGKPEFQTSMWACVCQCGHRQIVAGYSLRQGASKGCRNCRVYEWATACVIKL